jgi:hypothetical protein
VTFTNPPTEVDSAPFEVVVPFPAGTKSLQIRKGTTVLATVPVSAHAPSVTITAPTAGQQVSGATLIGWLASDADGDVLYHKLEYSHNGEDWQVLTGPSKETQFLVDFDALPGGGQARVRVITSDGVNTAQADSAPFVVPTKAPEVYIDSPVHGAVYRPGTTITLSGSAYDPQDGMLTSDSALSWSSDRDGVLGSGAVLNLQDLSKGKHRITLSAVNSVGSTASASTGIFVAERVYLSLVVR